MSFCLDFEHSGISADAVVLHMLNRSTKLNHAIGSAHAFIRVFERLAGEAAPTGAELEVLGQQLARVEAQFPIAQKWEKVLFLEYGSTAERRL